MASQFGAQVSPPPDQTTLVVADSGTGEYPGLGNNDALVFNTYKVPVPADFAINSVRFNAQIGATGGGPLAPAGWALNILGAPPPFDNLDYSKMPGTSPGSALITNMTIPNFLLGLTGDVRHHEFAASR